jgi:hypothetical protein
MPGSSLGMTDFSEAGSPRQLKTSTLLPVFLFRKSHERDSGFARLTPRAPE